MSIDPKSTNSPNTIPQKSPFLKFFWTSVWVVTGLIAGIASVLLYSYKNDYSVSLSLLWSIAYFVLGGLAGFVFGVPKVISDNPSANPSQVTAIGLKKIIQENTNLTQISDWLTKVIIGVGLVELKQIPPFILNVGRHMANGILKSPANLSGASMFCTAIIIFFCVWGFVCGYLIMRIVITDLLAEE